VGNNKSTTTKHAGESLAILIAMRVRRYDAGRIARWITSSEFTGSNWMQPSGECLRRIAPAATMVDEFVETTQNTNKKLFLAN
jgi:hypothetical protein